ncbi:MAG TPA: hypothetical protein VGD56_18025 [Gemmatirosa sp.]
MSRAAASAVIGVSRGRVVVLVRGAGLATLCSAEQLAAAHGIAVRTRAHLAAGPWYTRRLAGRALTVVFEDLTIEHRCEVRRYIECTVLAPP